MEPLNTKSSQGLEKTGVSALDETPKTVETIPVTEIEIDLGPTLDPEINHAYFELLRYIEDKDLAQQRAIFIASDFAKQGKSILNYDLIETMDDRVNNWDSITALKLVWIRAPGWKLRG